MGERWEKSPRSVLARGASRQWTPLADRLTGRSLGLTLSLSISLTLSVCYPVAVFSLFRKPRAERERDARLLLSLDIGTEVAKALVVEVGESYGLVRGSGRERQKLGDMHGGAVINIPGVVDNCRAAIAEAVGDGPAPSQMIIGIGGELVKGATTTIQIDRQAPETAVTLAELRTIVQRVQWKAFGQVRAQLAQETGLTELDVKLVDADIVDVRLDGYRIVNPLGFQGKSMTLAVYNAFAPLVHLGALQAIAEQLGGDLLAITAEPYAVSRAIRTEDDHEQGVIAIDIGGGTSDVAVIRRGVLEGTKMFALGGRVFTKRLAQQMGVSFEDAERVKLAYSSKRLDAESAREVRRALRADAEIWRSGVELTLAEFPSSDVLPSQIVLCGGGSMLAELHEVLKEETFGAGLPFASRPAVRSLLPADVRTIRDATGTLNSPQDVTPMALAALALPLAGEETLVSRTLRGVVRMMQT